MIIAVESDKKMAGLISRHFLYSRFFTPLKIMETNKMEKIPAFQYPGEKLLFSFEIQAFFC